MGSRSKVVVFTASFGGGHRGCAEAIRGYYRKHYADTVDVEVVDFLETFSPSLNVLARFAYQQPGEFFPTFCGTFPELTAALPDNPVAHELKVGVLARLGEYLDSASPSAVISTSSIAGGAVAEVMPVGRALTATVIVGLDARDTWIHPETQAYFTPTKEVREQLAVRGVAWDRMVVAGVPIREAFGSTASQSDSRSAMGLADRFTVLLMPVYQSPADVAELAMRLVETGVQVALVTGRNEKLRRKAESVSTGSDMLKVYGFVEYMHTMMSAADVIVSTAGELTVFEALASGLPPIVCAPVPGQEGHGVDFLVNCGAGLVSRDEEDVVEKVRFLSSHPDRLGQLSANAAGLGRASAAQVVCERVAASM